MDAGCYAGDNHCGVHDCAQSTLQLDPLNVLERFGQALDHDYARAVTSSHSVMSGSARVAKAAPPLVLPQSGLSRLAPFGDTPTTTTRRSRTPTTTGAPGASV